VLQVSDWTGSVYQDRRYMSMLFSVSGACHLRRWIGRLPKRLPGDGFFDRLIAGQVQCFVVAGLTEIYTIRNILVCCHLVIEKQISADVVWTIWKIFK